MRHGIAGYKLGRNTGSRKALFRSLARAVVLEEAIHTTLPKAKAVRPFVEKLITLGAKGTLSARRRILRQFPRDQQVHRKLVDELGPRFLKRPGGYTRILKLGYRHGDNAPLARLELTEAHFESKLSPSEKKKASTVSQVSTEVKDSKGSQKSPSVVSVEEIQESTVSPASGTKESSKASSEKPQPVQAAQKEAEATVSSKKGHSADDSRQSLNDDQKT
jgi:large subunit ribosomal protein L17